MKHMPKNRVCLWKLAGNYIVIFFYFDKVSVVVFSHELIRSTGFNSLELNELKTNRLIGVYRRFSYLLLINFWKVILKRCSQIVYLCPPGKFAQAKRLNENKLVEDEVVCFVCVSRSIKGKLRIKLIWTALKSSK